MRICTTADYKPYTYLLDDGRRAGIDVAMMENLAESMDASIEWINTTWRTFMDDFRRKDCLIAAGGISVTLKRLQIAWFSDPVLIDGKIPLVRCENKKKYETIEQLNNSTVHLIEPAGGTNEAFVRRYLPKAQLSLSDDNAAIFDQIVAGTYDVMVTDASEALYQQKLHPALCALNPDKPLQYGEKAYMLQKSIDLKMYVDKWLHLSKQTGVYRNITSQYWD